MAKTDVPQMTIKDAKLLFLNFSGKQTTYNRDGERNFCVEINPEDVDMLTALGWNIKMTNPKSEEMEPTPYLQVKVKYTHKPPRIVMVKSNGQVNLTEDMVSILDFADIKKVDLIINPSAYEIPATGKSGIAAYVKTMFVTIDEDELELMYSQMEPDEE